MDIKTINSFIQNKFSQSDKDQNLVYYYNSLITVLQDASSTYGSSDDPETFLDTRKKIMIHILDTCLVDPKFQIKPSLLRALISSLSQGYEPLTNEGIQSYAAVSTYINVKSPLPISSDEKEGDKDIRLLGKVLLSLNKSQEMEDMTEAFMNINSLLKVSPALGQVSLLKMSNPQFKDIAAIDPHKFLFGNFDVKLSGNKIIQQKHQP